MLNNDYGVLLTPDIKLHRGYFTEMVKLLGIYVLYRAPLPGKHYTRYTAIDSNYEEPLKVGCIFDEHPDQKTMRKIGWVSELQESSSIIHVPYDLPNLQQGALFIIPSGLDNAKPRIFRVVQLSNSMVYPASIACEIVPEYIDEFEPDTSFDFTKSSMTLVNEEHDRMFIDE